MTKEVEDRAFERVKKKKKKKMVWPGKEKVKVAFKVFHEYKGLLKEVGKFLITKVEQS